MEDHKQLAEFAADFLKLGDSAIANWPRQYVWIPEFNDHMNIKDFFTCVYAPHFAHLAKRKMEEMGFSWSAYRIPVIQENCFNILYRFDNQKIDARKHHENEYIALFMAIREAVNGNKD